MCHAASSSRCCVFCVYGSDSYCSSRTGQFYRRNFTLFDCMLQIALEDARSLPGLILLYSTVLCMWIYNQVYTKDGASRVPNPETSCGLEDSNSFNSGLPNLAKQVDRVGEGESFRLVVKIDTGKMPGPLYQLTSTSYSTELTVGSRSDDSTTTSPASSQDPPEQSPVE